MAGMYKDVSPHPSENSTLRSAFGRLVGMSYWRTTARKFHPIIHCYGGAGESGLDKLLNIANKICREMFVYVLTFYYLCIKLGSMYAYAYA